MAARAQARYEITAKDKTGRAFASVRKNLSGAAKAFGGFAKVLGGVAGIGGVGGMAAMIKSSIDAGDRIQKLSLQIGASTESLSQLKHAAELSGTTLESVATAMARTQRSAVEAADGTKSYADAYAKLGINVADFLKLAPEDQLDVMADKISALKTPAEQTAIAMELMGRGGLSLLPMLKGGAEGLQKMREEADKLGLTLTQDQADAMATANDSLLKLQDAFKGLANKLAIDVAPHLIDFLDGMRTLVPLVAKGIGALKDLAIQFGETAAAASLLFSGRTSAALDIQGSTVRPGSRMPGTYRGRSAGGRDVPNTSSVDAFLANKRPATSGSAKVEDPKVVGQIEETNRLLGEMIGEFRLGVPAAAS